MTAVSSSPRTEITLDNCGIVLKFDQKSTSYNSINMWALLSFAQPDRRMQLNAVDRSALTADGLDR